MLPKPTNLSVTPGNHIVKDRTDFHASCPLTSAYMCGVNKYIDVYLKVFFCLTEIYGMSTVFIIGAKDNKENKNTAFLLS